MADSVYTTKRLLSLRKLTRAVGELLRSQLKDHLGLLTHCFRPKAFFGEYAEGAKDYVKGAETNFKELQSTYESICGTRPYNLPKEFKTPLVLAGSLPEITPYEYVHEAKADGQAKPISVSTPLKFTLNYAGFSPKRLRELLAGPPGGDVQEFVLQTLVFNIVLSRQPAIAKLFEALRFSLTMSKIPGLGDLQFPFLTVGVPTVLPPDDVVIESTEISGTNAFEEVVNLDALAKLVDPFKDRLLELAKQHGEAVNS